MPIQNAQNPSGGYAKESCFRWKPDTQNRRIIRPRRTDSAADQIPSLSVTGSATGARRSIRWFTTSGAESCLLPRFSQFTAQVPRIAPMTSSRDALNPAVLFPVLPIAAHLLQHRVCGGVQPFGFALAEVARDLFLCRKRSQMDVRGLPSHRLQQP